jgi:hypothetical protein
MIWPKSTRVKVRWRCFLRSGRATGWCGELLRFADANRRLTRPEQRTAAAVDLLRWAVAGPPDADVWRKFAETPSAVVDDFPMVKPWEADSSICTRVWQVGKGLALADAAIKAARVEVERAECAVGEARKGMAKARKGLRAAEARREKALAEDRASIMWSVLGEVFRMTRAQRAVGPGSVVLDAVLSAGGEGLLCKLDGLGHDLKFREALGAVIERAVSAYTLEHVSAKGTTPFRTRSRAAYSRHPHPSIDLGALADAIDEAVSGDSRQSAGRPEEGHGSRGGDAVAGGSENVVLRPSDGPQPTAPDAVEPDGDDPLEQALTRGERVTRPMIYQGVPHLPIELDNVWTFDWTVLREGVPLDLSTDEAIAAFARLAPAGEPEPAWMVRVKARLARARAAGLYE